MEKHDPTVAVCEFVYGKVGRVIEGLLDKLQFAQTAIAQGVKFFHLLDSVAGIEINVAERNNLARMLSSSVGHYFPRRERSQHTGGEVERAAELQQVADEARICFVEMHMHVNNAIGRR